MGRLDGKVALITGGASGMGMVASRLFASEGASVVLTDVADDAGEAVAAEIETAGGQALYVHCGRLGRGRRGGDGRRRPWTVSGACTSCTTTRA